MSEHRRGATMCELESEAESLYETLDEQVGRVGGKKTYRVNLTHLRTGEGPTEVAGVGSSRFRMSLCS